MKQVYKITFFLIILLGIFDVSAQDDDVKNTENNASYFSINILSNANVLNPRWRVGYIQSISKKFKIGLDVGYGTNHITISGVEGWINDDYELWEVRPELYRVFNSGNKIERYMSLELFYINHKDAFEDKSYYSEDDQNEKTRTAYDEANYLREKYGFNVKYGFIFKLGKRVNLNVYSGLGIRIRKNTYTDVVNPDVTSTSESYFNNFNFYDPDSRYRKTAGSELGFNLTFGLKLLYKF